MRQPVDPKGICLADFVSVTHAQKEFCGKVEELVSLYELKISECMRQGVTERVSSVKISQKPFKNPLVMYDMDRIT